MPHLDEGTIHAWLDDALDPEAQARVEAHVHDCAACASAVAEARGLVAAASRILAALDATPTDVLPLARPQRKPRPWYMRRAPQAAAATVLVAVGLTVVMRVTKDERAIQQTTSRVTAPSVSLADSIAPTSTPALQSASRAPSPARATTQAAPQAASQAARPTSPSAPIVLERDRGAEVIAPMETETRNAGQENADLSRKASAPTSKPADAAGSSVGSVMAPTVSPSPVTTLSTVPARRLTDSAAKIVEPPRLVNRSKLNGADVATYALASGATVRLISDTLGAPLIKTPSIGTVRAREFADRRPSRDYSIRWNDSTARRSYILTGPLLPAELERIRALLPK